MGNLFDLTGKVAIVTGASSGLGRVFAEALAEFGADIIIADLDEAGANETTALLNKYQHKVRYIKVNVNNYEDVMKMAEEAVKAMGRIDILVNNAGISASPNKVADIPVEEWDRVIGVDLRGVFLCTKAVLPVMFKQKRGNIINIASVLGLRSFPELTDIMPVTPYNVAKAGVIALTREVAVQYARDGIRVNTIAPGWHVGTKLSKRWRDITWNNADRKKYEDTLAAMIPMGRRGEQSELRGLIIYLASDASSYITGQTIAADGGLCT